MKRPSGVVARRSAGSASGTGSDVPASTSCRVRGVAVSTFPGMKDVTVRVQGHARVPLRQPLPEDGRLRPLQVPHERPGPRRAHGVATAPDPPGRRSQAAPRRRG